MNCPNCRKEIAAESNFCYLCGARQVAAPGSPSVAAGAPRAARRLMRSVVDCKIAGVCGGIAEYLEVDSMIVRLLWVLLLLMPVPVVPAFVGYFIAWMVVPKAPLRVAPLPVERDPQSTPGASPHFAQPA